MTAEGAPERGGPVSSVIAGVPVVTIPATEYADLLQCRRRLAELAVQARRFDHAARSPIERDPELATFIAERLGHAILSDVRTACLERFGQARA